MVGVFAVAEVLNRAEQGSGQTGVKDQSQKPSRVNTQFPTWTEIRELKGTLIRCSSIGSIIGVLPGLGAAVAAFFGYEMERRVSKRGKEFGTGVLAGVRSEEHT